MKKFVGINSKKVKGKEKNVLIHYDENASLYINFKRKVLFSILIKWIDRVLLGHRQLFLNRLRTTDGLVG